MGRRRWQLATCHDDIGASGQFRNKPRALCQDDQYQDRTPGPQLPTAAGNTYDNEQQHQGQELCLVERSENDSTHIECDGSGDGLGREANRRCNHRNADGYACPGKTDPGGIQQGVSNSLRHGHIMHDRLVNDTMQKAIESQLASAVMMIRPARFESNPLTAASNRFQGESSAPPDEQQAIALQEFDELVAVLREAGIEVIVIDDTAEPHTPDAVFPNNWISMHADGRVVLYPMEAENRRTERRSDIIDYLDKQAGRQVTEVIDLSAHEDAGHFLEGTGSMVLDRANHVAYACISSRTHLDPLGEFAQRMGYDVVAFDAVDSDGVPIYHTNVLMNVGEQLAVICTEAIPRDDQRSAVLVRLRETGHEILELTYAQLDAFAGNMLELHNKNGERVLAMSQRAYDSLSEDQRATLAANARIVSTPIDNIESWAGGSVRCMLAEIHLPKEGTDQK